MSRRPDWTYFGWWRTAIVERLQGHTLPSKLDPDQFGGGRIGGYLSYDEIRNFMCSVQGCGRRAQASWAGCADENINRPLCPEHDVQINFIVLFWWGDPDGKKKLDKYVEKMENEIGREIESWATDIEFLRQQMAIRIDPGLHRVL
jgi:hypothetical protein